MKKISKIPPPGLSHWGLLFTLIRAFQLISISLLCHYSLQNGTIHTDLFTRYSGIFLSSEHPNSLCTTLSSEWQRKCGFSPFCQNKVISHFDFKEEEWSFHQGAVPRARPPVFHINSYCLYWSISTAYSDCLKVGDYWTSTHLEYS